MQCRCFVLHAAGAVYLVYKLIFKGHLSVLIIVIGMRSRAGRYMAAGGQIRSSDASCNLRESLHIYFEIPNKYD